MEATFECMETKLRPLRAAELLSLFWAACVQTYSVTCFGHSYLGCLFHASQTNLNKVHLVTVQLRHRTGVTASLWLVFRAEASV